MVLKRQEVGSWPIRKPANVRTPVATVQQHQGANIVDRIARGRLTGHPSRAIVGMGSALLGKRWEQGDRSLELRRLV